VVREAGGGEAREGQGREVREVQAEGEGVGAFVGFGPGAVAWFEGLERDNSRTWFQAHRAQFEADVRDPFTTLLEELGESFGGEVKVFRQHRDVRFSADKSPYKTSTYGIVHVPGAASALYAAVSSSGLYAGTGYWRMARDQLDRFHSSVLDDEAGAELGGVVSAVERAGLELGPPALKTAPRGLPRDHPRVALLRYKDLIAGRRLPPGPELESQAALSFVESTWRAAAPLVEWLDANVGASTLPREGRGRR
jgi:uncharacterized protein (TIGR02453 family)